MRWIWLAMAACAALGVAFQASSDERVLEIIAVQTQEAATAILARLKAGEDFGALARKHSQDPSAADGGYLGAVKLEYVLPELKAALDGVGPGKTTGVVAAGSKFLIAKVLPAPRGPAAKPQLVAYVSGFEEGTYAFSRIPKPENFHQDLKSICELKQRAIEEAIKLFESQPGSVQSHHTVAQLSAYRGDIDKAILHFEAALKLATDGELAAALKEKLAIAHLRKGEIDNCVAHHNARSCIFPLRAEARHKMQAGSQKAVALFREYLKDRPDDLEVKWLLNLGLMTLGAKDLPLPAFPAPSTGAAEFEDVAMAAGLDRNNNAGGAILEDFDQDGLLDLVISVVNVCEPMGFYRNNGDGTFSDRTRQAGLGGQLGGININHIDYNNDGWMDIFVMRGGWEFPMRNSLLKNNGNGTFTDVTVKAGLAVPAYPTPTSAWADFNHDGFADLFIGNENAPGQLFQNNGDGTFTDVSAAARVNRISFAKGSAWGDYDNDGWADLYVSNYEQENFLYRNNGDGTFTDVAKQLGVEKPIASFPTWFFDYNNDGCLDLFVSSYVQSVSEMVADLLKQPIRAETMKLYRNTCKGGFEDVSGSAGLEHVSMAMGSNFGDIDNDGFLDFYLGTGSPSYGALVPNVLYRNQEGKSFVDVTATTGTGHLQKGHGIAFGDIDHDGDQDIFLHAGGAVPGDTYSNVLFRNPGHGNHWLNVRLSGRKSNRAAVGARIKVIAGGREIHRVVSSGGSFGSSPFAQHIGLGKAARVEKLEIWWPDSGLRQSFTNIAADQAIEIVETESRYRALPRKPFRLGQ